uniref:MMS19 nucleotide excision repair protein n=1 Tax=Globodera pallida TaxID=36090 RepID=A0A183CDJ7_GLOPA
MCRDLLLILEEDGEASDLVEKFLGASTTQKELKQAGNFADEYTVLIKGIVNGLQPATETLRNSIGLLRSLLVKLNELSDSRENGGLSERLLETLLKIAAGHPKFEAHENLGKNCEQILKDFEHSILSLESKLLDVLKLAELNKKELGHLVRWFIALIYESGNDCGMAIDENIDVKLIGNLLSSIVTQKCGHETIGECVLDRVMCHLFSDCEMGSFPSDSSTEGNSGRNDCAFENLCPSGMSEEDKTPNGAKCAHWTLWGQIQKCLQHFQTLSDDGINSLVRPPNNRSKCIALSIEEGEAALRLIDFETDCEEEEEEEEIDGREGKPEGEEGVECRESGKKPISLHSFIFGHSTEERMECG